LCLWFTNFIRFIWLLRIALLLRRALACSFHGKPNPSGRFTFDVLREFTSANSSLKQCPARPASWSSPLQSSGRSHGANETIHLLVAVFTHASRSSLYSPHPCGSPANAAQLKRFKLVPDQFVGVPLAPLARYAHRSSPSVGPTPSESGITHTAGRYRVLRSNPIDEEALVERQGIVY